MELEHKVYWALKLLNFDSTNASEKRKLQVHELEELRCQVYESPKFNKEKVKKYHDKKLVKRNFRSGQHVLLFNSRLTLFAGKMKSKWSSPFVVKEVRPYGTV